MSTPSVRRCVARSNVARITWDVARATCPVLRETIVDVFDPAAAAPGVCVFGPVGKEPVPCVALLTTGIPNPYPSTPCNDDRTGT